MHIMMSISIIGSILLGTDGGLSFISFMFPDQYIYIYMMIIFCSMELLECQKSVIKYIYIFISIIWVSFHRVYINMTYLYATGREFDLGCSINNYHLDFIILSYLKFYLKKCTRLSNQKYE